MSTETESAVYRAGFNAGQQWAQQPTWMLPTNDRPPEFVRGFADGVAEWTVMELYTRPDAQTQALATAAELLKL